jgi:hypothetical protein
VVGISRKTNQYGLLPTKSGCKFPRVLEDEAVSSRHKTRDKAHKTR